MPWKPIGSEKAITQKSLIVGRVLEPCWSLGGVLGGPRGHLKRSWGCLVASSMYVGGYLERCSAILSHLGGHRGLSEALLEPS
eukprot:6562215-Pyramimonas_sp.AAC.1